MTPIHIAICSKDADRLSELVTLGTSINKNIIIDQYTTNPAHLNTSKVEILLADPNLGAQCVTRCHNLKWLQSTWAGNTPLTQLTKQDYTLTVARGLFDTQIREYVFTYLLAHVRKVFSVEKQKNDGPLWQTILPNYLAGKTLGIVGTGSLAKALLPAAQIFGLQVIGISRSGKSLEGFKHIYTIEEKSKLASQADFVVNLLPETPNTKSVLDGHFFSAMKPHSLLINAGRGSAIDNKALLDGLEQGKPSVAVLDVFDQEPLPTSHPFWKNEKIHITHHTAAITQLEDLAALFLNNLTRYQQKKPLLHTLNWETGY